MHIATYMRLHGISDADLAELVRCNRATISRVRRGVMPPSLSLASRIADATKGSVTPNDFIASGHAPAPKTERAA